MQPDPRPPASATKAATTVTLTNTIRLEASSAPRGAHFTLGEQALGVTPLTIQATQTEEAILDPKGYTVALDGHQLENLTLLPKRDAQGRLVSVSVAANMKQISPAPAAQAEAPVVDTPPVQATPPPAKPRAKRSRRSRRFRGKLAGPKGDLPAVLANPTKSKPVTRPKKRKEGVVIDLDL
jgi:hypothetical protein